MTRASGNSDVQDQVLDLLWAVLKEAELPEPARRVKGAHGLPLQELISELTIVERQVNNAGAHKAVALSKQVLTGKRNLVDFENHCLRLQGLI